MKPEKLAEKYNKEVAEFFGQEPLKNINVTTFKSQKDLIDFYNRQHSDKETAPDYLVGFSPKNKIYIIGPKGMPPDSDPGIIRFQKVLKHELVHKYLKLIKAHQNTTSWLVEGTCCHIANQSKGKLEKSEITLELLKKLNNTQDGKKYSVGRNMVDLIVENYGKEELIRLLTVGDVEQLYKELKKMFSWLK